MPTFATPAAIAVTVEMGAGDIHVAASDRTDTTVEVAPTNPANESDVKAAAKTTVDFSDGHLRITAPRHKHYDGSRKTRSVQITVHLPAGSLLRADAQAAHLHGTGALGEVRVKTALGDITLERAGTLDAHTSMGRVAVGSVVGNAEVTTGSGRVRMEQVGGTAYVKSSNGNIELGAVGAGVVAKASNGDITVSRPGAGVEARSAKGDIRVGAASDGLFDLSTALGGIDVEVSRGVVAKLDLSSKLGRVTNGLDEIGQPGPSAKTIEVHAHTSLGGVTVRRAA